MNETSDVIMVAKNYLFCNFHIVISLEYLYFCIYYVYTGERWKYK